MKIVETVGKWGVKTSDADYIRFTTPHPGDVVLFEDGSLVRIEAVGPTSFLKEDEISICEKGCSVFLFKDGVVDISGGPFTVVKKSELEPEHTTKVVRFWNWGDNLPGGGNGVDYYLQRPVFKLNRKKEGE